MRRKKSRSYYCEGLVAAAVKVTAAEAVVVMDVLVVAAVAEPRLDGTIVGVGVVDVVAAGVAAASCAPRSTQLDYGNRSR